METQYDKNYGEEVENSTIDTWNNINQL